MTHQFAALVLTAGVTVIIGCAAARPDIREGHGTVESVTQVDRDAARMGGTPSLSGVAGSLTESAVAGAASSAVSSPRGPVGGAAPGEGGPRIVAASTGRNAYEVAVRMDDGPRQRLTQEAVAYRAGDRVRVTPDGRLVDP